MTNKELKSEARQKLALNIHQAIIVYTVEFAVAVSLVALIAMSCVALRVSLAASIAMLCYGIVLFFAAIIGAGVINYAMIDCYLSSYRCTPYSVRRLGETLARCNVGKVLKLNLIRTLVGFGLLLCLIAPGVIYLSRTSMANHLLLANPSMKPSTALSASSKVMSGKTGSYFALMMSMFGWGVLCVVTLGLGFIFIKPYIDLTKTVYYKRKLQGDTGVYGYAPQNADGQAYYAAPQYAAPQARTVPAPLDGMAQGETARPIHIDPPDEPIAPIGALSDAEVREMNATMRDFGAPEVVVSSGVSTEKETIVPEVVISPVTTPKKTETRSKDAADEIKGTPVEGSDFVEIVKPLTTIEADEANVFDRKVNSLYSHSAPQSEVKHDYFAAPIDDDPNDFVTTDRSGAFGDAAAEVGEVAPAAGDPVMSDSAFADFIKNFDDVPTPQSEFKPLTRSKSVDLEDAPSARPSVRSADRAARPQPSRSTPPPRAQQPHAQPQVQAQAQNAEPQLSRTERARRAREERLKNL